MTVYHVEVTDTLTAWYLNGKLHSNGDQPAVVYANGDKWWYHLGKLHRDGDQPAVVYANGDKMWYQQGKSHRDNDQPAVQCANGLKKWIVNDTLHRETGPAVVNTDGTREYYLNGKLLTKEEHAAATQPAKEMTVAELEALLGYKIKVIADK